MDRNRILIQIPQLRSMERMKLKDKIQKDFGEALLKHRKQAKMTFDTLADRANLSLRYVQDLEAGRKLPSIITLMKLCHALKITPDKLLMPIFRKNKKQILEKGEGKDDQ